MDMTKMNIVLSCALLLVFSGLKWHILVTQFPKFIIILASQTLVTYFISLEVSSFDLVNSTQVSPSMLRTGYKIP